MVLVENELTFAKAGGGFSRKVHQGILGLASGSIGVGNFHRIQTSRQRYRRPGAAKRADESERRSVKTELEHSHDNREGRAEWTGIEPRMERDVRWRTDGDG